MGFTKRRVDVELTEDDGVDALQVVPRMSEWTVAATIAQGTAAATTAAAAGQTHVIKAVYGSYATADKEGLLTISDGTDAIEITVHDSLAITGIDLRAATNKTVAVSLATGGSSIIGNVAFTGYTIND